MAGFGSGGQLGEGQLISSVLNNVGTQLRHLSFKKNFSPAPKLNDLDDVPKFSSKTDRLSGLAAIRYTFWIS